MRRQLIKLDRNGYLTAVDCIKVRRAVLELQAYIDRCIGEINDPHGMIGAMGVPFIQRVLKGDIPLPLSRSEVPLSFPEREDVLPQSFLHYWAQWLVPATGACVEASFPENRMDKEGECHAWVHFEEPGDWPAVVMQYEAGIERRWAQLMGRSKQQTLDMQAAQVRWAQTLKAEEAVLEAQVRAAKALRR